MSSKKQNTPNATTGKSNIRTGGRSFVVPTFVPRESSGGKSLINSRRESITPAKSGAGGSIKVTHLKKSSKSKFNVDDPEPNFVDRLVLEAGATDNSDGKSFANCRRESIIPGSGGSIKATLMRNSSKSKYDIDDVKSSFLDRLVLEVEESDENKNHPASIEEQLENPSAPMFSNTESGKISPLPIVVIFLLQILIYSCFHSS